MSGTGPRVVSLVPSVTETLLAWGVRPVACTRFCEQPELVHVGGTKNPDRAAIVALAPDVVVMDEEENRREDHDALVASGVTVHVTAVRAVADVDPTLAELAHRLGARWAPVGPLAAEPIRHRAFVPIWRRPWMALGTPTYGHSLLASLGWGCVPEDRGPYPEVTLAEAAGLAPDAVLAPDEPYAFGPRHLAELATVSPAVRLVDGKDLFWWGVRTAPARRRLTTVLAGVLADTEPPA